MIPPSERPSPPAEQSLPIKTGGSSQARIEELHACLADVVSRITSIERQEMKTAPSLGTVIIGWPDILAFLHRHGVPITQSQAERFIRLHGLPITLRGRGASAMALDSALLDWIERFKSMLAMPHAPDEPGLTDPERAVEGESDGYASGAAEGAIFDKTTQRFGRRGVPSSPYDEGGMSVKGKRSLRVR
jgi:hypothetical protein